MSKKMNLLITKQGVIKGLSVTGTLFLGGVCWICKEMYERGRDNQRYLDSCEIVRILLEAGHDEEEIISIIQKKWDLTRSEVLDLLDEARHKTEEV